MGIFDSLLGRSKPPPADLDVLFAVPQASLSLQAEGFAVTGSGSVCYRDVEGSADDAVMADAEKLVLAGTGATVARSEDRFGFHWLTVARTDHDVTGLVTDLHAVNSSLVDAGFGSALLCSTIVFSAPQDRPLGLVYLYKRGTFYPFAPLTGEKRDNALELQVRGVIGDDVPVEPDLASWMAIWGAPGLTTS
ncbi:PspA-associated protein PspAB [Aeromicrobium sp.]|uniref:PspA-associated protein PspAB n=1 Tax=Aeromicrobium sp. TaxID=1871063 RepID=UPI003C5482A5